MQRRNEVGWAKSLAKPAAVLVVYATECNGDDYHFYKYAITTQVGECVEKADLPYRRGQKLLIRFFEKHLTYGEKRPRIDWQRVSGRYPFGPKLAGLDFRCQIEGGKASISYG